MVEKDASFGHFGWKLVTLETIYVIPYIYRSNDELVPAKIFQAFLSLYLSRNKTELEGLPMDFGFVEKLKMLQIEAELMNEINVEHNDSSYPFKFFAEDELLRMEDVQQITQYLLHCNQKLIGGNQYKVEKFGMVKIAVQKDREIIVPYVMKNKMRMVPVCLVKPIKNGRLFPTTALTHFDLLYMKFLCNISGTEADWRKHCFRCVPLRTVIRPLMVYSDGVWFRDYWPEFTVTADVGEANERKSKMVRKKFEFIFEFY